MKTIDEMAEQIADKVTSGTSFATDPDNELVKAGILAGLQMAAEVANDHIGRCDTEAFHSLYRAGCTVAAGNIEQAILALKGGGE